MLRTSLEACREVYVTFTLQLFTSTAPAWSKSELPAAQTGGPVSHDKQQNVGLMMQVG